MTTERILLAGLWLLSLGTLVAVLAGCREEQSAPPPPPKVTVSKPIVEKIIEWDEYTGRLEAQLPSGI